MDAVVLDATPLLDDRRLDKPTTEALLGAARRGELKVVVPRAVVEEVVAAARGSFVSARREIRKANSYIERHLRNPPVTVDPDVERLTDTFRSDFEGELRAHGVEVAEHGASEHAEIIERDLRRRKPFDASGRGYRDALIWDVVKNVDADAVIFVTSNTEDFADAKDDSRLHEHLGEEVVAPDRFSLVPGIGDVYERLGELRADFREGVQRSLEADPNKLASAILLYIDVPLPDVESDTVDGIASSVSVDNVYYAWGAVAATASAELEYYWSGVLDEWAFEDRDRSWDMDVVEWMDDSHSVVVAGEGRVEVSLTVAYDPGSKSYELLDADLE